MHTITISDKTYNYAQQRAAQYDVSISEVLDGLIAEELAMEAMRRNELRTLLRQRQENVAAGNYVDAFEALEKLKKKYQAVQ